MMNHSNLITQRIGDSIDSKRCFLSQVPEISLAADKIIECYKSKGKLLIFGNGGSAADAQHIAGELVGRYLIERKPLPAIALSTDTSILTALSNDYEFTKVFERQIEALAVKGDVLLGLTTSGNSENVIRAFKKGKEIGTVNISLTGFDGGKIKNLSDININSSSKETPRIQECHMIAYHTICEIVEKEMAEFYKAH